MGLRHSVVLAAVLSLGAAASASAHHSFVAVFDPAKPKVIQGVVTKLQWTNPHARFGVLVKDDKGAQKDWEVELGSPNTLLRYGWKRSTLNPGDPVTVDGYLARDGSLLMNAKTVKLKDGHAISAGSSSQGATGAGN
jgi:hypothetical protein